jgi:hypothetical protein
MNREYIPYQKQWDKPETTVRISAHCTTNVQLVNANREILLARPHPFIVAEMVPFLVQLGFTPVRLNSAAELAAATPRALPACSGRAK